MKIDITEYELKEENFGYNERIKKKPDVLKVYKPSERKKTRRRPERIDYSEFE